MESRCFQTTFTRLKYKLYSICLEEKMHPSSKVKVAPFDDAKFNDAFRSLVRKYQTDESGFGELGPNESREVFAFFGLKDGTSDSKFSLTNLRVLMLLNLLAKLQKRKYDTRNTASDSI